MSSILIVIISVLATIIAGIFSVYQLRQVPYDPDNANAKVKSARRNLNIFITLASIILSVAIIAVLVTYFFK
jgi:branched-subunit amino acid transport protein AzlD